MLEILKDWLKLMAICIVPVAVVSFGSGWLICAILGIPYW